MSHFENYHKRINTQHFPRNIIVLATSENPLSMPDPQSPQPAAVFYDHQTTGFAYVMIAIPKLFRPAQSTNGASHVALAHVTRSARFGSVGRATERTALRCAPVSIKPAAFAATDSDIVLIATVKHINSSSGNINVIRMVIKRG